MPRATAGKSRIARQRRTLACDRAREKWVGSGRQSRRDVDGATSSEEVLGTTASPDSLMNMQMSTFCVHFYTDLKPWLVSEGRLLESV